MKLEKKVKKKFEDLGIFLLSGFLIGIATYHFPFADQHADFEKLPFRGHPLVGFIRFMLFDRHFLFLWLGLLG